MRIYSFEKLDAWQEARKLVVCIYKVTAAFSVEEKFGISMNLRRAAVSVVSIWLKQVPGKLQKNRHILLRWPIVV